MATLSSGIVVELNKPKTGSGTKTPSRLECSITASTGERQIQEALLVAEGTKNVTPALQRPSLGGPVSVTAVDSRQAKHTANPRVNGAQSLPPRFSSQSTISKDNINRKESYAGTRCASWGPGDSRSAPVCDIQLRRQRSAEVYPVSRKKALQFVAGSPGSIDGRVALCRRRCGTNFSQTTDEHEESPSMGPRATSDQMKTEGQASFVTPSGAAVSCPKSRDRLLVVANRLPMTVIPTGPPTCRYSFSISSGGLVSGLRGIKGIDFIWIGWPGAEVPVEDRAHVTEECQACGCHPVYLDRATIDLFYNGFCNNVLWPLIHYIPPPMEVGCNDTHADQWTAYCRANAAFVEAILEIYEDGDIVWVHDYHLMLVPKFLRSKKPDARIGWFLHTPFPSQEIFRMLPYRTEILTGLLSANLIGFHVYDYLRHFISSCVQLLGLESSAQGINASPVGGVFVYCAAIPIGIETEQFTKKLKDIGVVDAIRKLKAQFGKRKVILGVDRLDYMKGLPHKLNAFDRFLELYPEWNERCVLVQLAVPSRTLVPEYQRLKSTVHELVGMINGKRGNLTHVPVHYLDQSLSLDELVALYRVADVALISSLRDGMNLVAYEFITCQAGKHGVLILSEFAGAAQSLGAGSIRVNPWNLDETAGALHRALTMSKAERRSRHDYALNHVHVHTSQKWAQMFIESLRDASERNEEVRASVPPLLPCDELLARFSRAQRRLIIVDLLDALTPARGNRGMPMKKFTKLIHLPREVLEALNRLSHDPNTTVIVTTPHPPATLERIFKNAKIGLAAEKGCVYRTLAGEWMRFVEERDTVVSTLVLPGAAGTPTTAAASSSAAGTGIASNASSSGGTAATQLAHGASIQNVGDSRAFVDETQPIPCASTSSETASASRTLDKKPSAPLRPTTQASSGDTSKSFAGINSGGADGVLPCLTHSSSAPLGSGGGKTKSCCVKVAVADWVSGVEKVFAFFTRRTPGSYTERTTGTLTWYWDDTVPDFGKQQSRDLLVHLYAGPLSNMSSSDVEVVVGSRCIEVRSVQCSRSKLMQHILEYEFGSIDALAQVDFIACIGNVPRRDEDIHLLFESVITAQSFGSKSTSGCIDRTETADILGHIPLFTSTGAGGALSEATVIPSTTDDRAGGEARRGASPLLTPAGRHVTPFSTSAGGAETAGSADQTALPSTSTSSNSQQAPDMAGTQNPRHSVESLISGLFPVYFSISVGSGMSRSKYRLISAHHVQSLVRSMALCRGMSREDTLSLASPPLSAASVSLATMATGFRLPSRTAFNGVTLSSTEDPLLLSSQDTPLLPSVPHISQTGSSRVTPIGLEPPLISPSCSKAPERPDPPAPHVFTPNWDAAERQIPSVHPPLVHNPHNRMSFVRLFPDAEPTETTGIVRNSKNPGRVQRSILGLETPTAPTSWGLGEAGERREAPLAALERLKLTANHASPIPTSAPAVPYPQEPLAPPHFPSSDSVDYSTLPLSMPAVSGPSLPTLASGSHTFRHPASPPDADTLKTKEHDEVSTLSLSAAGATVGGSSSSVSGGPAALSPYYSIPQPPPTSEASNPPLPYISSNTSVTPAATSIKTHDLPTIRDTGFPDVSDRTSHQNTYMTHYYPPTAYFSVDKGSFTTDSSRLLDSLPSPEVAPSFPASSIHALPPSSVAAVRWPPDITSSLSDHIQPVGVLVPVGPQSFPLCAAQDTRPPPPRSAPSSVSAVKGTAAGRSTSPQLGLREARESSSPSRPSVMPKSRPSGSILTAPYPQIFSFAGSVAGEWPLFPEQYKKKPQTAMAPSSFSSSAGKRAPNGSVSSGGGPFPSDETQRPLAHSSLRAGNAAVTPTPLRAPSSRDTFWLDQRYSPLVPTTEPVHASCLYNDRDSLLLPYTSLRPPPREPELTGHGTASSCVSSVSAGPYLSYPPPLVASGDPTLRAAPDLVQQLKLQGASGATKKARLVQRGDMWYQGQQQQQLAFLQEQQRQRQREREQRALNRGTQGQTGTTKRHHHHHHHHHLHQQDRRHPDRHAHRQPQVHPTHDETHHARVTHEEADSLFRGSRELYPSAEPVSLDALSAPLPSEIEPSHAQSLVQPPSSSLSSAWTQTSVTPFSSTPAESASHPYTFIPSPTVHNTAHVISGEPAPVTVPLKRRSEDAALSHSHSLVERASQMPPLSSSLPEPSRMVNDRPTLRTTTTLSSSVPASSLSTQTTEALESILKPTPCLGAQLPLRSTFTKNTENSTLELTPQPTNLSENGFSAVIGPLNISTGRPCQSVAGQHPGVPDEEGNSMPSDFPPGQDLTPGIPAPSRMVALPSIFSSAPPPLITEFPQIIDPPSLPTLPTEPPSVASLIVRPTTRASLTVEPSPLLPGHTPLTNGPSLRTSDPFLLSGTSSSNDVPEPVPTSSSVDLQEKPKSTVASQVTLPPPPFPLVPDLPYVVMQSSAPSSESNVQQKPSSTLGATITPISFEPSSAVTQKNAPTTGPVISTSAGADGRLHWPLQGDAKSDIPSQAAFSACRPTSVPVQPLTNKEKKVQNDQSQPYGSSGSLLPSTLSSLKVVSLTGRSLNEGASLPATAPVYVQNDWGPLPLLQEKQHAVKHQCAGPLSSLAQPRTVVSAVPGLNANSPTITHVFPNTSIEPTKPATLEQQIHENDGVSEKHCDSAEKRQKTAELYDVGNDKTLRFHNKAIQRVSPISASQPVSHLQNTAEFYVLRSPSWSQCTNRIEAPRDIFPCPSSALHQNGSFPGIPPEHHREPPHQTSPDGTLHFRCDTDSFKAFPDVGPSPPPSFPLSTTLPPSCRHATPAIRAASTASRSQSAQGSPLSTTVFSRDPPSLPARMDSVTAPPTADSLEAIEGFSSRGAVPRCPSVSSNGPFVLRSQSQVLTPSGGMSYAEAFPLTEGQTGDEPVLPSLSPSLSAKLSVEQMEVHQYQQQNPEFLCPASQSDIPVSALPHENEAIRPGAPGLPSTSAWTSSNASGTSDVVGHPATPVFQHQASSLGFTTALSHPQLKRPPFLTLPLQEKQIHQNDDIAINISPSTVAVLPASPRRRLTYPTHLSHLLYPHNVSDSAQSLTAPVHNLLTSQEMVQHTIPSDFLQQSATAPGALTLEKSNAPYVPLPPLDTAVAAPCNTIVDPPAHHAPRTSSNINGDGGSCIPVTASILPTIHTGPSAFLPNLVEHTASSHPSTRHARAYSHATFSDPFLCGTTSPRAPCPMFGTQPVAVSGYSKEDSPTTTRTILGTTSSLAPIKTTDKYATPAVPAAATQSRKDSPVLSPQAGRFEGTTAPRVASGLPFVTGIPPLSATGSSLRERQDQTSSNPYGTAIDYDGCYPSPARRTGPGSFSTQAFNASATSSPHLSGQTSTSSLTVTATFKGPYEPPLLSINNTSGPKYTSAFDARVAPPIFRANAAPQVPSRLSSSITNDGIHIGDQKNA